MQRPARSWLVLVLLAACGGGGGGGDGDDGPAVDAGPPTAYRMDTIVLRDPHLWAFDGSFDVTDTVNGDLADSATMDGDDPPDDVLDLSIVLVLRPADPAAGSTGLDVVIDAVCTAPLAGTTCTTDAESSIVNSTATNGDATCLAPEDGTTSNYDPAITTPGARCFVSDAESVSIDASGVLLNLQNARVAATYADGDPPGTITSGLFAGFMTEADAEATILPDDLPLVGGMPLSTLLLQEDKDTGPGGDPGWWFYFNFTATVVPFTE